MTTKEEVKTFLENFKIKMKIWDVIFRDYRGKNTQTLLDLEIRPKDRKRVLEELEVKDYYEGPKEDRLYNKADVWVFGKRMKEKEIYIKITMGRKDSSVICISFHVAEYSMTYPFA